MIRTLYVTYFKISLFSKISLSAPFIATFIIALAKSVDDMLAFFPKSFMTGYNFLIIRYIMLGSLRGLTG